MSVAIPHRVHFIGIGGIGMSALARYFNVKGIPVSGYDKTETDLTKSLIGEGINVHYEDNVDLIPQDIDLAVYTPAIPKDHKQLNYIRQSNTTLMKRAELLGVISRMQKTIAIAGTHGKTTTSSMVAHTLMACREDLSAFLGGILTGYNTNYFLGNGPYVVVEADEFDRSFLHLTPYISVVNSVDADHLDIYGTADQVTESYLQFVNRTVENGVVLIAHQAANDLGESVMQDIKNKYKVLTFGFDTSNDIQANILEIKNGRVIFDLFTPYGALEKIALRMPGLHNVSNAMVACTIALMLGKNKEEVVQGIQNFEGIKRRFEYIIDTPYTTFIDDYAHHPTELKMAIAAARMMYPDKRILGIFQPHLFTRTRDFMGGFAAELSMLDEVVLMDIYPARELPIEGITSQVLLDQIQNPHKSILAPEDILKKVSQKDFDIVMTLGAGNIDVLVPKIKKILEPNG